MEYLLGIFFVYFFDPSYWVIAGFLAYKLRHKTIWIRLLAVIPTVVALNAVIRLVLNSSTTMYPDNYVALAILGLAIALVFRPYNKQREKV